MSGDVQPRRRKDKKRKRDDRKSEGEVIFSRKQSLQEDDESSHGVHSANMGADDQHIHVHEDHGTGGNWYQKCAFIVLMAILLGLVGLIIMENRGLADLDTPLSESRYSDYLHGWVEEHREEHDDHDEVQASLEEHDEHDEPFEEEEDHSEADDEEEEEDEEEHDDEHDDDEDDDHDKDADVEDASEEATAEQTEEVDEDEDEDEEDNDDDDDEQVAASQADDDDDNEEEVVSNEAEDDDDNATNEDDDDENGPQTAEDDDDDNDDEEDVLANDDNDDDDDENNTEEEATAEASPEDDGNQDDNNNNDDDDEGDDDNEDDDDNNQADDNDESAEPSQQKSANRHSKDNDFDDPFDEEDDDGTAESFENIVVDNDAEEKLLLQEKQRRWAEQNQPPKDDNDDDEPEEANSFFANHAEPSAEDLMKRRLTISSAEVTYAEDEDAPPLSEDEEQQVSGEELEMEEEIEYVEEEEEIEIELDEHDQEIPPPKKYVPETFEDFNAMYRPKSAGAFQSSSRVEEIKTDTAAREQEAPITTKKSPAVFTAPPPPPLVEAKIQPKQDTASAKVGFGNIEPLVKPSDVPTEVTTREVTHDLDFQPDEDDIDYTDEDEYDEDEEIVEEEEEEIEDLLDDDGSDVDDTELMNRLEAKYGRLPTTNEYESDEDPDDPTWTQIKPKQTPGGGPQTQEDDFSSIHHKIQHDPNPNIYEDDEYEREMAFANDELLRGNHIGALVAYFGITHNYPDRPMGFLAKAKLSNQLAKIKDDTGFRLQSVDAFKRYLAFDDLITNNTQFREAAEECIAIMRDIGQFEPAITIHRVLINRFPSDAELRNQMVITYLMMDRYFDAKVMLLEVHKNWPKNGYALALLGYVLKSHDANYTGAIHYLQLGIDSEAKGTQDARFYIALGESYERLGKHESSYEIYKRGAVLKLYPSVYQRSVYNELNLRAQPIWTVEQTTQTKNFEEIITHWQVIRNEANAMLEDGGYFRKEMENLVSAGNWKELELFSRGVRNQRNCERAPTTCRLIEQFPAAAKCRRGQVKFSVMHPGTHVRPHCGPTNCRLRAHLGLIVPTGTKLRVANQNINWIEGAFLIFDDSFEHEVWHDGKHIRLVLIIDFWHPDLSEEQLQRLTTI